MKNHFFTFVSAVFLFLLAFHGFEMLAISDDTRQIMSDNVKASGSPELYEFLNYLIATVTGLAAVFLQRLLKKLFPDFEPPSKKRKNNF